MSPRTLFPPALLILLFVNTATALADPPPPPALESCEAPPEEEEEAVVCSPDGAHPRGPHQVALGSSFGCGLDADGTVRCWGRNNKGQGGDASLETLPTPRRVNGLDGVTRVAAGHSHACALRVGGQVWCWGNNRYGQLGVPGIAHRAAPAAVPGLEDMRELGAGGFFNCALRGDGAVLCWGRNGSGNLGGGEAGEDRAAPGPVPGVRADRLWVGRRHACVRDARGRVRCWGSSDFAQAGTRRRVQAAPLTTVRGLGPNDDLVLSASFSGAISPGGEVRFWGQNLYSVGTGSIEFHPRPVRDRRLSNVSALSAVDKDLCAVVDGRVLCWGPNRRHQLHVPTDEDGEVVLAPTAVPGVTDATDVVAGYFTQCLRRRDGSWACWGWNRGTRHSAVGVGSSESQIATPTRLPW
ncbi:MAG: hypothetical protein JRH11_11505 [Deltaproteobacteria bacterium]|nr:hypothetical protein [Deltaproteobacteria bacterium]